MNPLKSTGAAVAVAVLLAVILSAALGRGFAELGLAVWIHIVAGVMWLGLLYYFSVVQTPALAEAGADSAGPGSAAILRYISPRALRWFRWAAVLTWFTGVWYLGRSGNLLSALTLGHLGREYYGLVIGIGAWLGTLMLFNVWVFIWPNQKKILGLVSANEAERARAARISALVSRINFVLSLPLLLCMGGANHALPF
ncbi:MAG TPA: urate hydroxylase PuuD [Steroidobacteraceae bacterium]|nr:urate hydroxylase PuuD [Steroidobacteraceae bacterium]